MSDILLCDALKKHGIPYPKEDVILGKFTRWGDNKKILGCKVCRRLFAGRFFRRFR
jgi:hypothetical protein